MKKFRVITMERWQQSYVVEAESADVALEIAVEEGEPEENSFEYRETMQRETWEVEEVK